MEPHGKDIVQIHLYASNICRAFACAWIVFVCTNMWACTGVRMFVLVHIENAWLPLCQHLTELFSVNHGCCWLPSNMIWRPHTLTFDCLKCSNDRRQETGRTCFLKSQVQHRIIATEPWKICTTCRTINGMVYDKPISYAWAHFRRGVITILQRVLRTV